MVEVVVTTGLLEL